MTRKRRPPPSIPPVHEIQQEDGPESEIPETVIPTGDDPLQYIARTMSSIPPAPSAPAPSAARVPPAQPSEPELVAAQIRALEERLDRMIDEASTQNLPYDEDEDEDDDDDEADHEADDDEEPYVRSLGDMGEFAPIARPVGGPASVRSLENLESGEPTVFDTARELLSTDFYLRKWGRLGMRNRSEEVDDFGYDPVYEEKVRPLFDFLYDRYFRCETSGIDGIPSDGRCLLVANHSGTLPYDGAMIKLAVKREHPSQRDVRWLAEDFIFHFPFLGSFTNRIGAVRACQENAERLLRKEALVAVFPEGVKGIGKLFKDRYRLQRFGRGGFIKLCLRTNTPVVPVAVIGAEESNPMLARVEYFARALGLPYIPVTPTFPLLGPAGLIPAPTKWKIVFGEPIDISSYGAEAAEDEILVTRLAERVRATIQAMLDRALGERKSVWFG